MRVVGLVLAGALIAVGDQLKKLGEMEIYDTEGTRVSEEPGPRF